MNGEAEGEHMGCNYSTRCIVTLMGMGSENETETETETETENMTGQEQKMTMM